MSLVHVRLQELPFLGVTALKAGLRANYWCLRAIEGSTDHQLTCGPPIDQGTNTDKTTLPSSLLPKAWFHAKFGVMLEFRADVV